MSLRRPAAGRVGDRLGVAHATTSDAVSSAAARTPGLLRAGLPALQRIDKWEHVCEPQQIGDEQHQDNQENDPCDGTRKAPSGRELIEPRIDRSYLIVAQPGHAGLRFGERDAQPLELGLHVDSLEKLMDDMSAQLEPLENFILPGGTAAAAQLHMARGVCRRAERDVLALREQEKIGEFVAVYLNRLSDALFVMARLENKLAGNEESLWDSRA